METTLRTDITVEDICNANSIPYALITKISSNFQNLHVIIYLQ